MPGGSVPPRADGAATEDPFLDKRDWWAYLEAVLVGGSDRLRQTLPVDENGFRYVAGFSHRDARAFFLYEVLDEVQKTGIAISRWVELLDPGQDFSWLYDPDQVSRLILETVIDEQRMRVRKLVEALIVLVNFETTNEDPYYRHFLLLADYENLLSAQNDTAEFYGQPRENLSYAIEHSRGQIENLESTAIDRQRAWYAGTGSVPGRIFSSTRQRLKAALGLCSDAERVVLGFTYGTFAEASEDVHFSATGSSPTLSWTTMTKEIGRAGLLGLSILIRCQRLTGTTPEGLNRQLREIFDANEVPTEHVRRVTHGDVEVGDFVLVMGTLAEVTDVSTSSYGYRSYQIAYLAERPIDSIERDWYPAFAVRPLYNRQVLLEKTKAMAAQGGIPSEVAEVLEDASPQAQQRALRESLIAAWNAGLREAMGTPGGRRGGDVDSK